MMKIKILKILNVLTTLREVKHLDIVELEFIRDVLNKDLEVILNLDTYQLIEILNNIMSRHDNAVIERFYMVNKVLKMSEMHLN